MNEYKILATVYNEAGSLTDEKKVYYYGSVDMAETQYNELNRQRYEGGGKKYKVELYVRSFKSIADPAAFFAQFK